MSSQAAYQFLVYVNENAGLQEKIGKLSSKSVDDLVTLAHNEGYEFSKEELHTVAMQAYRSEGELSDNDLESISGGIGYNVPSINLPPIQPQQGIIAILIGL